MKHLFSSYPDGIAGWALLILRGSAVACLSTVLEYRELVSPWMMIAAAVVGLALVLGIGTRPAALLAAAIAIPVLLASRCLSVSLLIGQTLSLVGLMLLGPGAMSIDARLFGRRKISLTD